MIRFYIRKCTHFLYVIPIIEMNCERMQDDRHHRLMTTVIGLQTVFVGLLKPDYYNIILQDKGKRNALQKIFDVSPHGRL